MKTIILSTNSLFSGELLSYITKNDEKYIATPHFTNNLELFKSDIKYQYIDFQMLSAEDIINGFVNKAFLYVNSNAEFNEGIRWDDIYNTDILTINVSDFINISIQDLYKTKFNIIWLDIISKHTTQEVNAVNKLEEILDSEIFKNYLLENKCIFKYFTINSNFTHTRRNILYKEIKEYLDNVNFK